MPFPFAVQEVCRGLCWEAAPPGAEASGCWFAFQRQSSIVRVCGVLGALHAHHAECSLQMTLKNAF